MDDFKRNVRGYRGSKIGPAKKRHRGTCPCCRETDVRSSRKLARLRLNLLDRAAVNEALFFIELDRSAYESEVPMDDDDWDLIRPYENDSVVADLVKQWIAEPSPRVMKTIERAILDRVAELRGGG